MRGVDESLPPRIWVVGTCGSGKSTVARALAGRLGVEATHIDDLHWRPGWVEAPPEETARRVAEVVALPSWVIDGNYSQIRRAHMASADLTVWLDLPFRVTFWRLLVRTLLRSLRGTPCCNGNRESLSRALFHRDSILLWAITTHRRRRRQLAEDLAGRAHVRLRSQREVGRWLARSEQR